MQSKAISNRSRIHFWCFHRFFPPLFCWYLRARKRKKWFVYNVNCGSGLGNCSTALICGFVMWMICRVFNHSLSLNSSLTQFENPFRNVVHLCMWAHRLLNISLSAFHPAKAEDGNWICFDYFSPHHKFPTNVLRNNPFPDAQSSHMCALLVELIIIPRYQLMYFVPGHLA